MNIRSLTRGDGAVIGAAVLLLISSFLPFFSYKVSFAGAESSQNLWHSGLFPILPSVTLAALVAAAAVFLARSGQFDDRQPLGLSLEQWGVAISLFVGWTAVWATLFNNPDGVSKGIGNWLTLIFGVVIGVAAPLRTRLPALQAPLLNAPRPAPQPYGAGAPLTGGAQPYGAAPQQAGYGYPGGAQSVDPSYGQAAQQTTPYGAAPQAAAHAPAAEFTAFWFAVPVPRPLYAEDGSGAQIAELTPGTWYLAVDQHGQSLIAQTQDGRRGVLQDSSGIQRG
ncbi:hypothetical protein [Actinacidiphila sp. ITFR-21]|uniref:hypothetical protein n=1 Tax=Actinacidiphila sp. ITFR-21 TaxID=3075199 RepID=UPI00288B0759|nr:hypothetical protein [Streptomyces sp. ITFR-21]WNI15328.1 hypothetical protein RLT57_07150 [Streptomyces sp. ITFR-21]